MRQTRQIINISNVRITYSTKQQNQKLFHLTKLYKQRKRKDFLWRSAKYSGSWYECPRVLRLAPFLVGGSKWFKACFDEHNLQNRPWSDLFISSASHTSMKIAKTLQTSQKALILLTSSTDKNPPHAGRAYKRGNNYTLAITNSWASGRPWWRR